MSINFLMERFADLKVFLRNKISPEIKVRGILYYLIGLSYEETARVLRAEIGKVSKVAVYKWMSKAKTEVSKLLKPMKKERKTIAVDETKLKIDGK